MWPQALQMTRDECRGILRRLELESYSQVISVFRAQGGLSDAKAKLLEELRGIFHISNERHRAEARRVANDEQLATIAEATSGPNTWQEWSREGRRPYPMLPRVAPQTALALIANNVADQTANENIKLPYPADTAEAIKEEQLQIENQKIMETAVERNNYVVTNDPFKIPQIPTNIKKNLKRNTSSEQHNSGVGKKRNINDNSPQKMPSSYKQYPHITANSPQTANNAATSPTNVSERKQKQRDAAAEQHVLKQRFFYQQHQMTKQKLAKKAAATAANNATMGGGGGSTKRQATPAKSGRRANQKMQMEHQKQMKQLQMDKQQQHQQQQQAIPMQIDLTLTAATTSAAAAAQAILTQQQLDMQFVTYAQQHQPPQQIFMEKDILDTVQTLSPLTTTAASSLNQHLPHSLITPLSSLSSSSPQIAASKRDISKNLNKLQMQQTQLISSNVSNTASTLPPAAPITSHDLQTSLGNVLPSSSATSALIKSTEKSLISTTPVQKYIVEERQPGVAINIPTPAPGTVVNLQNPPGVTGPTATTTHMIQVSSAGQQPQIMTLPQFSAAATKLRAVNTTLIAPGAKITATQTKKKSSNAAGVGGGHSAINAGALHELANIASTQSQVLHIVESAQGGGGGGNNSPNNVTHLTPLHTPPAVIQIHNASGGSTSTSTDISSSTQSKVLTTKILPLVLKGTAGNQINTNTTLINNSSLVVASSPTTSISITSTTSTAQQPTYMKNLPSTMVLNTSTANLTPVTVTSTNNTNFSTLGAGATMFRKPPNIIKTSHTVTTTTTKSSSSISTSSAPHIISNVKLTPVSVSSTNTGTHLTTTNTFKKVMPSTSGMVRTSVKICQSPNGKVFIQPAGLVDATKMKLNTSSMTHKIISNTSSANNSSTSSGGQRIAIQKVQIYPAPMGSPAGAVGGTTLQSGNHHHLNTKTSTLTGKSNMIFMPTSATNVRPVTLSKMGNNILLKSSCNQHLTTTPTTTIADTSNIKPNIVVLGPATQTLKDHMSSQSLKLESNQLINEDTPLDILNMPIVMESEVGVTSSSVGDTVTLLQSNIIETSNTCGTNAATSLILEQTPLPATQQTVILGATDWEMELDQAITTAANTQHNVMAAAQNQKSNHKQKRTISCSSSASSSGNITTSSATSSQHKHKRLNSDLVSIELKTKESHSSTITTTTNYTTNSSQNVIVVDDSFDDVIVEDHEDDTSTASNSVHKQHHDDTPKILDMQIYQQHDGHDNKIAQISSSDATTQLIQSHDQQDSTIPSSEREQQQQQPHQHDCEIDAGFDETIVTEIDENTAIEYIEEDGGSETPNVATTTTAMVTNKNIMPLTTSTGTTAAATTAISNQDDTKSCKNLNATNNHLASSTTGESTTSATTTKANSNEILTNETSTTTANNSATQQVEP